MSKPITRQNVKDFVDYMAKKYGVTVITKKSPGYGLMKFALMAMGVKLDMIEPFLTKFSFTLPGMVWFKFTPGEGDEHYRKRQIGNICHEFRHVKQWDDEKLEFAAKYVLSPAHRSHYEAQALHCDIEMGYAMGLTPKLGPMIENLKYYMVTPKDRRVTKKHLKIYNNMAKKGLTADPVSIDAIKWWGF